MFNLFKKKRNKGDRIAEIVASHILAHISLSGSDDIASYLSALQHDKYVLGYIMGVSGVSAKLAHLEGAEATGHVIGKVLDLLFPKDSLALLNKAISLSSDPVFVDAAQFGMREFSHAYLTVLEAIIDNNEKPEIELPSLDRYLSNL